MFTSPFTTNNRLDIGASSTCKRGKQTSVPSEMINVLIHTIDLMDQRKA